MFASYPPTDAFVNFWAENALEYPNLSVDEVCEATGVDYMLGITRIAAWFYEAKTVVRKIPKLGKELVGIIAYQDDLVHQAKKAGFVDIEAFPYISEVKISQKLAEELLGVNYMKETVGQGKNVVFHDIGIRKRLSDPLVESEQILLKHRIHCFRARKPEA